MSTLSGLRRACPDPLRPAAHALAQGARRLAVIGRRLTPASTRSREFARIYRTNGWRGPVPSGPGSDLEQTAVLRRELPGILRELGARSLLDAPCGDLHWMRDCELPVERYIGADIVPELVAELNRTNTDPIRTFVVADLVTDDLPRVDVILCRDCLVHLPARDVLRALANFKRSGATYLLTTTFPELTANSDLDRPGQWRKLNLQLAPYSLPEPALLLNEGSTWGRGDTADKSLGLWRLADLGVTTWLRGLDRTGGDLG